MKMDFWKVGRFDDERVSLRVIVVLSLAGFRWLLKADV